MPLVTQKIFYKISVSIVFGILGFFFNFYTIIFPFGEYTVAILFGLIFPLLITLSWGWQYGLLSAASGGCQSMWWLWGPSNGYAVFLIVPMFTLWIIWHGIFASLRRKQKTPKWWLNMYVVEIPFRILSSVNLLTLSRWAISLNPPPWDWAHNSATMVPMHFSVFVLIKQGCVAFILLLLADVLLNVGHVRAFFRLKQSIDYRETGHILSVFLLLGCLFWGLDSLFHTLAFHKGSSFIDLLALDIPDQNLFIRTVFFIFCIASGLVTSKILRRQREVDYSLREAEKEATDKEKFLRTLIRAIPDLVWVKDTQGVYLSCNSRFENFFGAKEADIIGKTDYDFVDRELANFFRERDKDVMTSGKPGTNEEEVVFLNDGHRELLETTKTPLYDSDRKLIGVLGIGRDITERANLQAQLSQAQKMESVGRLAGGVAHDFNNMLSVILGNAELIMEDLAKDNPFAMNIKEIQNAAERSSNLTRQLLAFARKQTISPETANLNTAINGILKMLDRLIGEDINLVWKPGENLWHVKIDLSQLDQILANLCINSRDSIKSVGRITIRTENVTLEEGHPLVPDGISPGNYVMLMVSDTGCGMSKDTMAHIFEPFYTTKKSGKGTGLGLSTVYGVLKQNKGFINVYSEPGQGSTFRIYLPRHTENTVKKSRSVQEKKDLTGRESVLLVEDEVSILEVTKMMLERLGYRVLAASTPDEALRLSNETDQIHLLITDVIMPGMNGRDLAEKLSTSHPDIKILFISGYTRDVITHHGILDEGLNFISKPFSMKTLSSKLRDIFDLA